MMERNLRITLAYDGAAFHGWQIQENAMTVQEVFQKALYKVVGGRPDLKACSRTDSGVHARMFCLSVKTPSPIPCARLVGALNHYLPRTVAVLDCEEVDLAFHARYACLGKEYAYEIWNHPVRDPFLNGRALHYWYKLDETRLEQAARCFEGSHDFTSFCTRDAREEGDLTRIIYAARVVRQGHKVQFVVRGNGFLYNMVRIMVGTLLKVAEGKITPEDIPRILAARDRGKAGPTAPAQGLYLNRVYYDHVPNSEGL